MPVKKRLFLTTLLACFALTTGACMGLTAIPGVVILPGDDHQIVVLEADQAFLEKAFSTGGTDRLVTMELTGGDFVAYYDGKFSGGFVSAFDAHPLENEIAYVVSEDEIGTSIYLTDGGGGTAIASFPLSAEQGLAFGTQLSFSPDGQYLAVTLLEFPPGFTMAQFQSLGDARDVLDQVQFGGYVLDLASYELTPLNDPTTEALTTLAWNPTGTHLAYTAWQDTNGDGQVLISPLLDSDLITFLDHSQLRIREVATGTITPITSATVDVTPEFLDDNRLAYVAYEPVISEELLSAEILAYDLDTAETTPLREIENQFVSGLAVSPDASRVAWVESPLALLKETTLKSTLYVSDPTFVEPIPLEIAEFAGMVDVPVWIPDANAVVLTAGGYGGTIMVSSSDQDELAHVPTIIRVDLDTGEQTVLSDLLLINPSMLTFITGLIAANPELN